MNSTLRARLNIAAYANRLNTRSIDIDYMLEGRIKNYRLCALRGNI